MSVNYISFPTKVVFRSCKLVPTMVIATVMNRKIFSSIEYMCAFAICTGLVFFSVADWKLAPTFNPIGLVMVFLSVCADAVLPNAQERLFGMGASRVEVTFFTNIFTLIAMTAMTLASGDLVAIIRHAMVDHQLALYMGVYTAVSYIAISAYMRLVKGFGGVSAVYLTTARKAMTLVLSFLLFPKDFSWFYVSGAGLVLGSLMAVSLYKQKIQKEKEATGVAGAADQPARRRGSEGYVPLPSSIEEDDDLEAQQPGSFSTSSR
jgi:adenosine 3'-phospho 5'-phosphosulfate transporter B3